MGKRYKEFLLSIITTTYQIILAIGIATPVFTKIIEPIKTTIAVSLALLLFLWGTVISAKMEV